MIRWMVLLTLATYLGLLCFESLPTTLIIGGLVAQVTPFSSPPPPSPFLLLPPLLLSSSSSPPWTPLPQVAHLALLSSFPFFSVTSASFIVSVVMVSLYLMILLSPYFLYLNLTVSNSHPQVLANHYLAFKHFGETYYPFSEVGGFV